MVFNNVQSYLRLANNFCNAAFGKTNSSMLGLFFQNYFSKIDLLKGQRTA